MGNSIPHGDRLHECGTSCPEAPRERPVFVNGCGYAWCGVGRDTKHFHKSDDPHYVRASKSEDWQEFPDFYQRTIRGDLVDRGDFGFPGIGSAGGVLLPAEGGPPQIVRPLPENTFGLVQFSDGSIHFGGPEYLKAMIGQRLQQIGGSKQPISKWDIGDGRLVMAEDMEEINGPDMAIHLSERASPELREIVTMHLPDWYALFEEKNTSYQNDSGSAFDLGIRGQYSDMHRKFMKLRKAMWDAPGQPLVGEQLPEILLDLIGHCFLTLCMLDDGSGAGEPAEGQEHQDDKWGRQQGEL